ncbi:MAG: DUF2256 domain-containing protein [Planctomycetaceae bacterium]|nr:DUF2256 domain-containing protein [Planctomycetaceae bacterium]
MPASNRTRPIKICCVCNRPFTWRRKWAAVWDSVRYCSERCRRSRHSKNRHTQNS